MTPEEERLRWYLETAYRLWDDYVETGSTGCHDACHRVLEWGHQGYDVTTAEALLRDHRERAAASRRETEELARRRSVMDVRPGAEVL